ncbi:MAG: DNA-binding protein [Proteobacteria bacterium]|nr:MAG: DNA-binding protein [Pseudomonadota bacterium]
MSSLESTALVEIEIRKDEMETKLRSLTVKRWLRTDEVALYLGTTREAVKKMVLRGKLEPNKFCGRNYFDRVELDGRIENSSVRKTNELTRRNRWR